MESIREENGRLFSRQVPLDQVFRRFLRSILARRFGILAFLVPFVVYALTLNGIWATDYSSSILGLQYSLWAHHSFSLGLLGSPEVQSVDVGVYNGNYYSEISPGFAIVSLPFAILGFLADGNTFNVFGHVLLADETFLALASSLAAFFVYKICRFYSGPVPSLLASLTFAVATPLWPLTTMIYIQGASVMFSTASLYLLLRHVRVTKSERDLVLAGICLGAASFIEYMAALFVLPIIVYLLIKGRGAGRVIRFLDSFSIGPLLWLTTNYLAFSKPFIFPEQLKAGPILNQFDFGSMLLHAAAYIVSPYRGILVFSPVLILGLFMIWKMIRSKDLRADALLFLSLFILILLGYSAWHDWSGGLVYGPRFLMLGIPYLAIPISIVLTKSWRVTAIFFFLFEVSLFEEWIGAFTTALSNTGGMLTYQLYAFNMPWFMAGRFVTWWFGILKPAPIIEFQLVAIIVLVLIAAYCFVLVQRIPLDSASKISET